MIVISDRRVVKCRDLVVIMIHIDALRNLRSGIIYQPLRKYYIGDCMITINIPSKPEFYRWYEITKFKLFGGFACVTKGCSNRSFFDQLEIKGRYRNTDFIFGTHTTANHCVECVTNEIMLNANSIFAAEYKCDWCDESKPTVRYYNYHPDADTWLHFTFGERSWNGADICESCLVGALTENKDNTTSSMCEIKGDLLLHVNRLGLSK